MIVFTQLTFYLRIFLLCNNVVETSDMYGAFHGLLNFLFKTRFEKGTSQFRQRKNTLRIWDILLHKLPPPQHTQKLTRTHTHTHLHHEFYINHH